jgi:hypothetical protein
VLAYLSRYTHRVAISNRRLIALNQRSVTFKVKDYRIEGPGRYTTMTLDVGEFIRRFLSHVLPKGFHRIRHYGLFASTNRTETMEAVRKLLDLAPIRGRADEPDRSSAAARPPLPLLRRPDVHHRDLRTRLPTTAPAYHVSGGNQDRYLMSVDTSCTTAPFCAGRGPATLLLGPIRTQHCISDGSQRQNTASASLVQTRSPIHYPQSQDPGALTASATRPTTIKSP